MAVRKELDDTVAEIAVAATEQEVRELLQAINKRIVYVNTHTIIGPPTTLMPLDVEDVVARIEAMVRAHSTA